jgi:hypothetical protein
MDFYSAMGEEFYSAIDSPLKIQKKMKKKIRFHSFFHNAIISSKCGTLHPPIIISSKICP